jgi:hypothetical protein
MARLLAAGTAVWVLATPAMALDGNDLVKKINASLHLQPGLGLVAGSVSADGDTVTLRDSRFELGNDQGNLQLGTIELEGVTEENGGYQIDTITFQNIDTAREKTAITVSDMFLNGVRVPASAEGDTMDAILTYDKAHMGPMAVSVDGKPAITIASGDVTTAIEEDKTSFGFDVKVNGIKGDPALLAEPQTAQTLAGMGITSLDGTISMVGSWDMKPGTLALQEYVLDFADIGRLDTSLSFSGYNLDFIRSANETASALEANPNKEEAQQAASLAMLGLFQRLTFNSAQIRFDDDGVTKRALDYAGKERNTTGEQIAQLLKAMTPLFLAQYNMPDLQNMLSAAMNTYLDDPKSLTITAQPPKAVPFPMIMGAAMGAPNTLPKVLGVTVTAND